MPRFALDLTSLSLPPMDGSGRGVLTPGKDVLRCWPDQYDSAAENAQWSDGLSWPCHSVKEDCGFEQYTMNYAFHTLFDYVPTKATSDGKMLIYSANGAQDFDRKQMNFYRAFAYIHHYPRQTTSAMRKQLQCSTGFYHQVVEPTIYSIAQRMSFLDWNLRLWDWNHTETFLERVTLATDGFPIKVCTPGNRFLARLLKSGKYNTSVVKGEYTIALGPGFPIEYCGPHIGIRHDSRLWMENRLRRSRMYRWEYGLGDKAYVGCPELLTEFKKPKGGTLTPQQNKWNLTLQHYCGRVEHLIGELVHSRAALNSRWRGSFSLLAAIMKICAHMVGLQERMKGPRYDVFGPWPVCPANVVAAY